MKILTLIFTFTLIFQLKAQANTNISHAIAMHGEPKYSKNFENVEYINPNSIKGGSIEEVPLELMTASIPLF